MNKCPKCGSNDWDYANVGLIGAIVCTDCGEIYMMEDSDNNDSHRCDKCGSNDTEAIVIDCYGIETNCYQCLDCDHTFGGDL